MKRDGVLFLICVFLLSVLVLVLFRFVPTYASAGAPTALGADAALWQVQTTLLSVGFAGLAIAAQLFADAPTAVGASRNRVLIYVRAGWFVGIGLTANLVIGIQTMWLSSTLGVLSVALFWFVPTVVFLVYSSVRLMALFGNPSRLDEVVRSSLIDNLANRLDISARNRVGSQRRLKPLDELGVRLGDLKVTPFVLRVPVPRAGLVVKGVSTPALRHALALLAPKIVPAETDAQPTSYFVPQISVDVSIGDRTRLGQTGFRVGSHEPLEERLQGELSRILQSSLEFEAADSVTPDEETSREVANLQDTIGVSLRAGAFETAERALELLAAAVRGVWTARPGRGETSNQVAARRPEWLFRSIWEVERDALLSPRSADMFVSRAMSRAIEAPTTNSLEYVEECLRSFEHLWIELLRGRDAAFEHVFDRICICLQNLAEFSFPFDGQRAELQARAAWTFVAIVKHSLDAQRGDAALRAARELAGLFEYGESKENGRNHLRAGQLVLSGWLRYLDSKSPKRAPKNAKLRGVVTPKASMQEILRAREVAEAMSSYSRWDWWDMRSDSSKSSGILQMSRFIDLAELWALAESRGPLPEPLDQSTASLYERLLALANEQTGDEATALAALREVLIQRINEWRQAEQALLASEPISPARVTKIEDSLRKTLSSGIRLAAIIPNNQKISSMAEKDRPILGMNLRVPRDFLVDRIFNNTYTDSSDLGQMIARGFEDAEDARIVSILRRIATKTTAASEANVIKSIEALGNRAKHFVLLTPYGGLLDIDEWRSGALAEALGSVRRVEVSALETEAILFDPRSSIRSVRKPEQKEGLTPVDGTMISLGVIEDVRSEKEPQVRVEAGEHFVVWAGPRPNVEVFTESLTSTKDPEGIPG